MKVDEIEVFTGVNYYSYHSAVVAKIDMQGEQETAGPENLVSRLFETFPSLAVHRCRDGQSLPRERRDGSVDINDLIEHVARELMVQADPLRNETHRCLERRVYDDKLVIATMYGETYRYLVPQAVGVADALMKGEVPLLENILDTVREILEKTAPVPSDLTVVAAAKS